MTIKRFYYIMVALTAISALLVAGTTAIGIKALRSQSDKLIALKIENQTLEEQDRAITLAQKDLLKYQELSDTAKTIVPQDKDQAKTIREIDRIASENGIQLNNFGFEASTLGTAAKTPPKTTTDNSAETAPKAPLAPPVTQVEAVPGMNGVYQLPITTQALGNRTTYPALINFLQGLEKNRRTAQVQQISIQPDAKNPSLLNFTLQFNVYLRP